MISTSSEFDAAGVRRYIQRHGLDPVPHGEPIQAVSRNGATLTVETYGWGRVFFAEWRGYGQALTWLEHEGKEAPALPAWASELRALVDRPECLGHHAADHICDGGLDPDTGRMERPCRWRGVCQHVQKLAQQASNVPAVLQSYTDAELWEAVGPSPATLEAMQLGRRQAARQRKADAPGNLQSGTELVHELVRLACEKGGWQLCDQRWRSTVGQFFLVEYPRTDRDSASYILFRRRLRGTGHRDITTEQSICRILTQTSAPRITVQLRTGAYDLVRQAAPSCKITETYDTHVERKIATFRSVGEDELEEVAQAMVQVVEGGHLTSWGNGALDPDQPGEAAARRREKWANKRRP